MIFNYFKTTSELERTSEISHQKSKTMRKDVYPPKIVTKQAASQNLESDFIPGPFLQATPHSKLGVQVPVLSMCSDMVATEHEQNIAAEQTNSSEMALK